MDTSRIMLIYFSGNMKLEAANPRNTFSFQLAVKICQQKDGHIVEI